MSDCTCKNCAMYRGNCGHHFIDNDRHIDYEIPSESMYGKWGGGDPECWRPSVAYKEEQKNKRIQSLTHYSVEELEKALQIRREKDTENREIGEAKKEETEQNKLPEGMRIY